MNPIKIVVGVSGGIAAYKACEVIRRFKELGHSVRVIPTPSALKFVGLATFEALSGEPVTTTVWERVDEVAHVSLGQEADLVVVVPATANTISRVAQGSADDLLTSTLLVTRAPILFAPAMHTEMWQNVSVRENVATLIRRGIHIMEPAVGRLTGADSGAGRLPDPVQIVERALSLVVPQDLVGQRILITAGGTRESIDPVRFLGNRSSGKQGIALARNALSRGAQVTLIAANIADSLYASLDPKIEIVHVESAEEMNTAVWQVAPRCQIIVMAAAVADFRVSKPAKSKLKKSDSALHLDLISSVDILHGLLQRRSELSPKVFIVGFAAETGDLRTPVELAQEKLAKKPVDLLVLNVVAGGAVFGEDDNQAVLIVGPLGHESTQLPLMSKDTLAGAIFDHVRERLT